ncbi:MAG: hypothetical protein M1839_000227 [Geoglossum umbratile]|nr:MAG: hypothetical protein M1839_000227 [Geoglossum umbratile]
MVLIIKEGKASIIVAPTHAGSSKRKWQRSANPEEPLEGDAVGFYGLLEKMPAGIVKHKAVPTIFWTLPHDWKLVASLEEIIMVVPPLGGIRRGNPRATIGVTIPTNTRYEGPFRA